MLGNYRGSAVDLDTVRSGTFWPGRIWIRTNGIDTDLDLTFIDKKICIVFAIFSSKWSNTS
jgi:hypothetical protein